MSVIPGAPDLAAATAAAAQAAAQTSVGAPWHSGKADAEVLGFWQNKGWDVNSPADIAIQATKAYHEAQKFVGAPPTELVRLPKTPQDEAGWKAVWQRLGAPGDAAGYDFTTVKRPDGSAPDAALTETLRATAARLNLPKDTAAALAQDLVTHLDTQASSTAANQAAALAEQKADLAKNWGANHDANMFVARQAAAALGVKPEQIAALEGQVGYAGVMEMFRNIGTKIGEDKFVNSQTPGGSGVMSVEQAKDQKRSLMNDTAWSKRYLAGDMAAIREMTALNTLIASVM